MYKFGIPAIFDLAKITFVGVFFCISMLALFHTAWAQTSEKYWMNMTCGTEAFKHILSSSTVPLKQSGSVKAPQGSTCTIDWSCMAGAKMNWNAALNSTLVGTDTVTTSATALSQNFTISACVTKERKNKSLLRLLPGPKLSATIITRMSPTISAAPNPFPTGTPTVISWQFKNVVDKDSFIGLFTTDKDRTSCSIKSGFLINKVKKQGKKIVTTPTPLYTFSGPWYTSASASYTTPKLWANDTATVSCVVQDYDWGFFGGDWDTVYAESNTLDLKMSGQAPAAQLALAALPPQVPRKSTTQIVWDAKNVYPATCSVSGSNSDAWVGESGAQITAPILATTTYTLSCQGYSGLTVSTSTSVGLWTSSIPPLWVASCGPTPNKVAVGEKVTWTVVAQGGTGSYLYELSGAGGLSGTSASVDASYTTDGVYTAFVKITSGSQSILSRCGTGVEVGLGAFIGTVDLSAVHGRVKLDTVGQLQLKASGALSCTITSSVDETYQNNFTMLTDETVAMQTHPLSNSTRFTAQCIFPGGIVSDDAQISVLPQYNEF